MGAGDWVARAVFGRLLPKRAYPVLRGPLRGGWFVLGAADGPAGGATVLLGLSEPAQVRALAALLRPGDVFFDVGANVGHHTLVGAARVGPAGRVFAFEPVVRNLSFLYRHVALNRAGNVTILPFACSDRTGLAAFDPGPTHSMGRLAGDAGGPRVPVATVTVDEMAARLGVRPAAVKIDVEGAEEAVLAGAADTLARDRPAILLSTHGEACRDACLRCLRGHGYRADPLDHPDPAVATEYVARPG